MRIKQYLRGGDRRSIGKAADIVALVTQNPALLPQLVTAMASDDPLIAMRASDVAEKISRQHIEWFAAHRAALLRLLHGAEQQEVVWHLAQIVPRLALTEKQRTDAVLKFNHHLGSDSRIVVTFALQALYDLSRGNPERDVVVQEMLRKLEEHGPPSVRARARKLLKSRLQQKGRE